MVVHNPNNWHWVDKNCMAWARQYFDEKLAGLSYQTGERTGSVTKVSSIEGDVEVSQRKGKVISLFDLKLILDIAGNYGPAGGDNVEPVKGSITIPELAYDSAEEDLQFDISIYEETTDEFRLDIKKKLVPLLRKVLAKFGTDLIVHHSSDIQVEADKVNSEFTKANQLAGASGASSAKAATPVKAVAEKAPAAIESKASSTPKYNTSTLHLEPVFNTTAEQLYITLLDDARISAWTRSLAVIESFPPSEGSEFKFFGGSVTGTLLKLVPNERIVQLWRLSNWKAGHHAELDIQFVQGAGETKMMVKFTGIPIGEEERVRGNFEDYYVRSIKVTFGFGAVL